MSYRIQAIRPRPFYAAERMSESIECPTAADALVIFGANYPDWKVERIDWEERSRPPVAPE